MRVIRRRTIGRIPSELRGILRNPELYSHAQFFVGLNQGNNKKNRPGACTMRVRTFRGLQQLFFALRQKQVDFVGATSYLVHGLFGGAPEQTTVFHIAWFDQPREATFDDFEQHMRELANWFGRAMCQDEVWVQISDGRETRLHKAVWHNENRVETDPP